MPFTNQEAMKLTTLITWIQGLPDFGGKRVSDAEARAAARFLLDRASKTGCCIMNGPDLTHWPVRTDLFTPGTCAVCGCTDDRACEEGCCWVNEQQTLCSACAVKLGIMELFTESPLQKRIRRGQK